MNIIVLYGVCQFQRHGIIYNHVMKLYQNIGIVLLETEYTMGMLGWFGLKNEQCFQNQK